MTDDIIQLMEAFALFPWYTVVGLVAIVGILGFVVWKAFPYGRDLSATLVEIRHEFKNNSGSTLRDAIDRIEKDGKETRTMVVDQTKALNDHIAASAERGAVTIEKIEELSP